MTYFLFPFRSDRRSTPVPTIPLVQVVRRASLIATVTAAAAAVTVAALPLPAFRAISRSSNDVWLLDEFGRALYRQSGMSSPQSVVSLKAGGVPNRWAHPPRAFTSWHREWLFATGTDELARFDERGVFKGTIHLPEAASSVVTAGGSLWIYNFLPSAKPPRLWTTTDAIHFEPVNVSLVNEQLAVIAKVIDAQAVIVPGVGEGIAAVKLVGPPRIVYISPNAKTDIVDLAYSRRKFRSKLVEYAVGHNDPEEYSSPACDVLIRGIETVVIRNREDVPSRNGPITVVGLHADRYVNGQQVATATFRESVRWILAADSHRVVALSLSGGVLSSEFGPPLRSEILP